MEHLKRETIARLVDEAPGAEEAEHLATCHVCASELDAIRAQTRALASLPEIRPPLGDWEVLEARLRSEGLVEDAGAFSQSGLARTPGWMRTAAAVAIFLGGTAMGAGLTSSESDPGTLAFDSGVASFAGAENLDQATEAVQAAEQRYVAALTRYRQLLEADGGGDVGGDPRSRYAALEYLVAASQAAVRQAPADPFLNGLLASTLAERETALRRISTRTDNWF
jgi:hypothetical protein